MYAYKLIRLSTVFKNVAGKVFEHKLCLIWSCKSRSLHF